MEFSPTYKNKRIQKIPPALLCIYPDVVLGHAAVNKIDKNLYSHGTCILVKKNTNWIDSIILM